MSFLIKGMERLTPGLYFVGVDNTSGRDKTIVTVERMLGNRDVRQIVGSFEAIPVPHHGRLGDLDALHKKFSRLESEAMSALKTTTTGSVNWIKWSAILTERTGYKHDIADAPIIIPAEEVEE